MGGGGGMGCRAGAVCGRWGRIRASRPGASVAPGRPRRVRSGGRPLWRARESFQGEEAVGDRDERDVVLPAGVGAALEVVKTERVFELAVVLLDAPAQLGQLDESPDWGVCGQVGQPVVGWRW